MLRALAAALVGRRSIDLAGTPIQVLAALGIHVSERTARETVRILAGMSVIVRWGGGHSTVRIRLAIAYRSAVARAAEGRITAALFDAGSDLLGRDPEQLCFQWPNQPRVCDGDADTRGPDVEVDRAPGENLWSHATWLRSLPRRPWILLAGELLVAYGHLLGQVEPLTTAHARALLVAGARPTGHRDVAALLRALRWIAARDDLDGAGLVAERHPDAVILGVAARAETRACSPGTAAYLRRRGVVAPEALGHAEGEAIRAKLWARAQTDAPTLADLRLLAGLPLAPASAGEYSRAVAGLEASWSWHRLLADNLQVDRAEFSARARGAVRCGTAAAPVPSTDVSPPTAARRHDARPSCPGHVRDRRRADGDRRRGAAGRRAVVGGARPARRVDPAVPPGPARRPGHPPERDRIPVARAESPAVHPSQRRSRPSDRNRKPHP